MSYQSLINADQRLHILNLLANDAGYSHNHQLIALALKRVGHAVSHDKLLTQLAWLAEQELINLETVQSLQVARITRRGIDVAQGSVNQPGVARPGP